MNENYATAADLDDMFGMPDPDSDGPMCDMDGCTKTATHAAIDIDGTTKIVVCTPDSYNNRLWGVWPIENDSDYGAAVGAAGLPIHTVESNRRVGEISKSEYRTMIGYAMADVSNKNRWRNGTPGITLDKSGDDVGGFIESIA